MIECVDRFLYALCLLFPRAHGPPLASQVRPGVDEVLALAVGRLGRATAGSAQEEVEELLIGPTAST